MSGRCEGLTSTLLQLLVDASLLRQQRHSVSSSFNTVHERPPKCPLRTHRRQPRSGRQSTHLLTMELETDHLDQICFEVDETIERVVQVTEEVLTSQSSTIDKLLND